METYARILLLAMPAFLFLVLFEKWYGYRKRKDPFRALDTISSLSSGYTNVLKDVLGLSITIISYDWFMTHFAFFKIENTIATYIIAFIALDFMGYWVHRLSHEVNLFWNKHAIHHSSEEYNLACALRQSISSFVNIWTFFLIPAAIFGVPPIVIATVAPLHLFAQFWYHTVYIGKMGFLEKIIVTPSHHRVHHSINPEYMDKNHSQIFIIWDKLFGTFQEELPDVPPVYGITRPVSTWNPVKINFMHLWILIKDAWRAPNIRDKFRIWFMPTGWRPEGFDEKYPIKKISDPYHFKKYDIQLSQQSLVWVWVQFLATLGFLVLLFLNISKLDLVGMLTFGVLIFLHVYSYTEFMDKNPNAIFFEIIKNLYLITGLLVFSFWSPIISENLKIILILYGITATILTWYFAKKSPQLSLSRAS
ncbi:MAG: sterol desaturase family protein [Cytophagaceae bacterium]|nr:sterol desaturase family protein [Cytophagaceae bacterium]